MVDDHHMDWLWGLPVAVALVLAVWVTGEGGAASMALLQLTGASVIPFVVLRRTPATPRDTSTRFIAPLSLAFAALAVLSLVFSHNKGITAGSVVTVVAGVALMNAARLVPRRAAVALVAVQVVLVAPISVSAILEPLGGGWLASHDYFPGRATANMGGPGPLGALLAMAIPVSAAFFLTSSRRSVTITSGIVMAPLLAALTATFSRAAMMATCAGLLVVAVATARAGRSGAGGTLRRRTLRRVLVVVAMAALIIPAYNGIVRRYAPEEFAAGQRPGTQTFQFTRQIEGSELTNVEVRVLCWGTALRTIAENPLTGVGSGCFGVATEGLIPDGLKQVAAARGLVYAYAYNDYLQIAAELGIPALVAFVALLTTIFVSAGAAIRRQVEALHGDPLRLAATAGVAGALTALLTQALADFPLHLPSHQTLLWVDLGLLGALVGSGGPRVDETPSRRTPVRWAAAAVAVLLTAGMATVATRAFVAERNALAAVRLNESGDLEEALARATRSTELAPHEHTYWVLLAETANAAAASGVNLSATLPTAFDAYRRACFTYPDHAPTYGRTGALYLAHAATVPGAVDSAGVYLRRAIALNRYYADPHTNLGTVLMMTGDRSAARLEFLQAATLDTEAAAPLFNLGNLELASGRMVEAEAHYRAVLTREPAHAGALINLSALLISDGRLAEARENLRAALLADPGSEQALALLSTIEAAGR